MPTRSGLSIYCYTAPTNKNYSNQVIEIGNLVTDLSFASAAPGGFTTFSATLPIRDGRIPLPTLSLFSMIAVMNGPDPVWLGEVTDPEMGMDATDGEYIRIGALGLGNALRDDPESVVWNNAHPFDIIADWLSSITTPLSGPGDCLLPTISNDVSYIFPDRPSILLSPAYDNRTFEEMIADVCTLTGDYQWGVWAHPSPSQSNAAGFRLGVLSVQARDPNTTHYTASVAERDVTAYNVVPSAERAYNAIGISYGATSSGGGASVKSYQDPRLSGVTSAQKNAPFRFRGLVRDYSGTSTIGATQAQQIANTYGAEYQNPSNKISLTLQRIKDAYGNPIPLWEVFADHNILIRDFAPRAATMGQAMSTTPTPGVNQFYIVNAEYREDMQGTQEIQLQCDNFVDKAASQIARLTLAADSASRSGRVTQVTQVLGAPTTGFAVIGQNNAASGVNCPGAMQWPAALYRVPTSVSFTTIVSTNLGAPSALNLNALGGRVTALTTSTGSCVAVYTYSTSGNCIRRIGRKYLDWHCDGCGKEFVGLSIPEHVQINTGFGIEPGMVGLSIVCPECAATDRPFTESFNTGLTGLDETGEHPGRRRAHHPHRREQARFIRQLMRHGAVGLEVLP